MNTVLDGVDGAEKQLLGSKNVDIAELEGVTSQAC